MTEEAALWLRRIVTAQRHGRSDLERLIQLLGRLPGLGPRSARRAALHLLKKRESPDAASGDGARRGRGQRQDLRELRQSRQRAIPAPSAAIPSAIRRVICVVAEVGDLWALERSATYRGRYHVLGGTLSALDGIGPEQLNSRACCAGPAIRRCRRWCWPPAPRSKGRRRPITSPTGWRACRSTVSRLAHGLPVGGELDYLDDGTLMAALKARRPL